MTSSTQCFISDKNQPRECYLQWNTMRVRFISITINECSTHACESCRPTFFAWLKCMHIRHSTFHIRTHSMGVYIDILLLWSCWNIYIFKVILNIFNDVAFPNQKQTLGHQCDDKQRCVCLSDLLIRKACKWRLECKNSVNEHCL